MPSPDPRALRPGSQTRVKARAIERASAILDIDLDAIAANYKLLTERLSPGTRCAAVVKADAYGLGVEEVVPALARAGCKTFFVATIDEGLVLRALLPKAQIAVLNGLVMGAPADFAKAALLPVLNDLEQVRQWHSYAAKRGGTPAMLHIDTGLARLGLPPKELKQLGREPELLQGFKLALILSHLACAGEPAHPMNLEQLNQFRAALRLLPQAPASLASSSAIFLGADFHFDMVRAGAALYGVNPLPGRPNGMKPVLRLKAKILQVQDVDRGQGVGYGAAHRMDRPGRVATVALGYADGWLRSSSQRGTARIAGHPAPVIGRISMDLLTLDVTNIDPQLARPGAYADLLDEHYGVDDAAFAAGTIGYEVLTALGRRCLRLYRGGGTRRHA